MEDYTKQCYDVATRIGLSQPEAVLGMPCEDDLLPYLAGFLYPWRDAAPFLDLREIHVHDIERDYGSESARRLGALRRWKASKGRMATYAELIKALLAVGRVDQAENVCTLLTNKQKMEIKSVQSAPPVPARDKVTYADLQMDVPSSPRSPWKQDSFVPYTEVSMPYVPEVPLVGDSDSDSKPPPVPLRTYKSLERKHQQSNVTEKTILSRSKTCPPAVLPVDNGVDVHPPPIPVRSYRARAVSIDDEITRLDEEYVEIESAVLETIRKNDVPVKRMLQWVLVLPMVLKAQFSELLQTQAKAMSTASNVDELFLILSQYWNSLHPSLLEHLIKKLQDIKLSDRMSSYMKELKTFRISTNLGDFVNKWVGRVPPGLDEFRVELGDEWKKRTIHDLEQFRNQLSRQKCFNGNVTYVKKVVSGSILVVFATSQSVFPLKMKGKAIRNLMKEYNVLRVSVKGNCILNMQEPCVEEVEEVEEADNETKLSSDNFSSSEDSDMEYNDGLGSLPPESSNECLFPRTISREQWWHTLTDLILSDDCLVTQSHSHTKGEVHATKPLHRTGEFEIKVEVKGPSTRDGFFGIGIRRRQHSSPDPLYTLSGCCIWQTGAIYNSLKKAPTTTTYQTARDLELLIKGDRVGMRITREGDLEFFVNGRSQGVAAYGVYKPSDSSDLYPLIKLPAGYTVRITAGAARTSVISLRDISIECVARSLKTPKDIKSLSLPQYIEEELIKSVLDPNEDFS